MTARGPRRRGVPLSAACVAALVGVLAPLPSGAEPGALPRGVAPTRSECVRAFEDAQIAEKAKKLVLAREKAALCSQAACPAKLIPECAALLPGIDRALPTLALDLRDGDAALAPGAGARLLLDGVAVAVAKALAVDPGEHALSLEASGRRVEVKVTVKEGERDRRLVLRLPPLIPSTPPAPPPRPPPPSNALLVAGASMGGAALVGFAGFAIVGGLGLADKSALEDPVSGCKPFCSEAQLLPARAKLNAADVLLGTGIALGTGSAVLLVVHAATRRGSAALAVVPVVGPVLTGASLSGTF